MSQQGFTVGDFDPAWPLDDKFLALRALLIEATRFYAAAGIYWYLMAAAWRDGQRKSADKLCPDADASLLSAMVSVGLLDDDRKVTQRAYLRWIGSAKRRRQRSTDYKRRYREGISGVSPSVSDRTDSDSVSQSVSHTGSNGRGPGKPKPRLVIDETPYDPAKVAALLEARARR